MGAGLFVKPNGGGWVGLPARSHPMTRKLEQDLDNLKSSTIDVSSCACKADTLCNSISGLGNLYKSIADLLKQPLSQQALSSRYQDSQRCVDDLLQDSVTFLDVCGNTRDLLPNLRAHVANLQSCLVKRSSINNGRESSLCLENGVFTDYFNSIKTLQREMGKSVVSLKQTDAKLRHYYCGMFNGKGSSCSNELVAAVVRVLSETSFMSSIVFRSILNYFSAAGASQTTKVSKQWSLVLRFVHSGRHHAVNNDIMNEFQDLEASLNCFTFPTSNRQAEGATTAVLIESVCRKLSVLELTLERLEKELECLFRELIIQARVSFLNILSHHS